MYVQRNFEARSCNHCCSGKAKKEKSKKAKKKKYYM